MNKTDQLAALRVAEHLLRTLPLSSRNHLVAALDYWFNKAKNATPLTRLLCALSQTEREIKKS